MDVGSNQGKTIHTVPAIAIAIASATAIVVANDTTATAAAATAITAGGALCKSIYSFTITHERGFSPLVETNKQQDQQFNGRDR